MHETGKLITNPVFQKTWDFKNGFARVRDLNSNLRFINKYGEFITDTHFEEIHDFSEGYAAVRSNRHWGYIDTTGQYIVKPRYYAAGSFPDGKAAVLIKKSSKLFGLISPKKRYGYINNQSFTVSVPPKFTMAYDFSNNIARVKTGKKKRKPG